MGYLSLCFLLAIGLSLGLAPGRFLSAPPAPLVAPQSDQTEPPACEHLLYFSAIP